MRHLKRITVLATGILLAAGCGGSGDNHVDIITQSQTFSAAVQGSVCDVGYPGGQSVPGGEGGYTDPLYCIISFQSLNTYLADEIRITVTDVSTIFLQLGTVIPFGADIVFVDARLLGQMQPPLSGSIRFLAISNIAGDRVEADFQIFSGINRVEGHFTTSVRSGYGA
ncbi:MAG: hypothetical protein V1798_10855 [Pseudomonadota bacterium]